MLYDTNALCGEGPFYDESREELVWVDIDGKSINFLNVNTKTNRSIQLEDKVGAAIPCEDDDSKLIAVIGRSICLVDRESGDNSHKQNGGYAKCPTGAVTDKLASVEEDQPTNRFNDAKCDRQGRMWCGTMSFVPETSKDFPKNNGNLYTFSDGGYAMQHNTTFSSEMIFFV